MLGSCCNQGGLWGFPYEQPMELVAAMYLVSLRVEQGCATSLGLYLFGMGSWN